MCSSHHGDDNQERRVVMNESRFATKTKDVTCKVTAIRSSLAGLASALAICSPVRVLHAQPAQGHGMHDTHGGWMGGWAGGGMWLWTVIGVLVVALLVVVIGKLSKK
jgi:uncharacterized membrane protein